VLGSVDEARAWLTRRHQLLGDRSLNEVAAATEDGAKDVERILNNIEYGLPVGCVFTGLAAA
jgi:uncharacterized protein (DUF2384 family)